MSTPSTFSSLGLGNWLCRACSSIGFNEPTEIQRLSIPAVLAGKNVLGAALTGSGKTAAFALPILHHLSTDPYGIHSLILTPTRELAFQLAEQFRLFGKSINAKDIIIVGGLDMLTQSQQLSQRPHIVIATIGRLADHCRSAAIDPYSLFKHLQFLVLDEADRLLEAGFAKDLSTILSYLPPPTDRQTLLFSATLDITAPELIALKIPNPAYISTEECRVRNQAINKITAADNNDNTDNTDSNNTAVITSNPSIGIVDSLSQSYLFLPQHIKECYLVYLLTKIEEYTADNYSIIVFTSTCKGCTLLTLLLTEFGLGSTVVELHSELSQSRRLASLGKFRSGRARILISTDIASRGLDIPTVQLVINYDVPRQTVDYIHRVGRTARNNRSGESITLVSQYDINIFKSIESNIGIRMEEYKQAKESDVLLLLNKVNKSKKLSGIKLEEYTAREAAKSSTANSSKKRRNNNNQQQQQQNQDQSESVNSHSNKKSKSAK